MDRQSPREEASGVTEASTRETPWLRRYGPVPSPSARVICLPYGGGSASMFKDWALPPELRAEVLAVQLPGRETRIGEAPYRRVEPLVRDLAEALRPVLERPFMLVGHSMGATIAFELARYLRDRGGPRPFHLLVSGRSAVHLPAEQGSTWNESEDAYLRQMERAARESNIAWDRELCLAVAPAVHADFELCDHYAYREGTPLTEPITCVAAVDDTCVTMADALAWRKHTTGTFRTRITSGGHLFIRSRAQLFVDIIATRLAETIQDATAVVSA